jgi:hypothetical protein
MPVTPAISVANVDDEDVDEEALFVSLTVAFQ